MRDELIHTGGQTNIILMLPVLLCLCHSPVDALLPCCDSLAAPSCTCHIQVPHKRHGTGL